ncbi:probable protein phosphatase 2C 2 [Pistacia vera]|uniref:probable protein phosphatase 2C 2 n=1 Tax=Pistacia vera TaxID=55513 RepID=UPI00126363C9|nr:probable protein phosphatase 2C 2 [Pistacia vera]
MLKSSTASHKQNNFVKSMLDLHEFLWGFSIVSLVIYLFRGLRKAIAMASLSLNSPLSSPSLHPLSWVGQLFLQQGAAGSLVSLDSEIRQENHNIILSEEATQTLHDDKNSQQNFHDKNPQENSCVLDGKVVQEIIIIMSEGSVAASASSGKGAIRLRKRPARLVVPENCANLGLKSEIERNNKLERKEFEVEGKDFTLASKKGRREVMEDGYGVMVDILGDPKQAFFAVIDGHGGRAAADYVAENLGRNIVKELGNDGEKNLQLEDAIRKGYQITDTEFLSKGVSSGACTASVLLKNGELHVANAGDCRVVLSRKGIANSLTMDHRLNREDERLRIENAGGFVHNCNGVWRVQGTLAVSRSIGDLHLKQWIISEPEIRSLPLTSDCEFLIMASDGLWDKVNEQEAVDVVSRDNNSLESCKKLIEISSSRGNMDDITVMVINLQKFVTNCP